METTQFLIDTYITHQKLVYQVVIIAVPPLFIQEPKPVNITCMTSYRQYQARDLKGAISMINNDYGK